MSQTLQKLRKQLKARYLSRSAEIDGLLTALLAKEHVLLFGPPGTGKSALTEDLCGAIQGGNYFRRLLTRTTVAEEVLGVVPAKTLLEAEDYIRKTDGKLPDAHIGFLDEIFKCNSTVLNALLSISNERLFDNPTPTQCPLITLVGASNELPEDEGLQALDDRFLLRFWIDYLPPNKLTQLLTKTRDGKRKDITASLTLDELADLQVQAQTLEITDDTIQALVRISDELKKENIVVSDRTWVKCLSLLRAYALLNGLNVVDEESLDILAHVLWKRPDDKRTVQRIIKRVGNSLILKAHEIVEHIQVIANPLLEGPFVLLSDRAWAEKATPVMAQIKESAAHLQGLIDARTAQGKAVKTEVFQIQSQIDQISRQIVEKLSQIWSAPSSKPVPDFLEGAPESWIDALQMDAEIRPKPSPVDQARTEGRLWS